MRLHEDTGLVWVDSRSNVGRSSGMGCLPQSLRIVWHRDRMQVHYAEESICSTIKLLLEISADYCCIKLPGTTCSPDNTKSKATTSNRRSQLFGQVLAGLKASKSYHSPLEEVPSSSLHHSSFRGADFQWAGPRTEFASCKHQRELVSDV